MRAKRDIHEVGGGKSAAVWTSGDGARVTHLGDDDILTVRVARFDHMEIPKKHWLWLSETLRDAAERVGTTIPQK